MAGARQPIDLIVKNGKSHMSKKQIVERKQTEIKANNNNIVAPNYLTNVQKEEFYEIARELQEIDILSNIDCNTLGRYVVSLSTFRKVAARLREIDIEDNVKDYDKLARLQKQLQDQCLSIEKEFGMTIASRCKLVKPKEDKKINPLLEALEMN